MKAPTVKTAMHLRHVLLALALSSTGLAATGCSDSEAVPPKVPVPGGGQVGTGDLSGTPQAGQQWTAGDEGSSAGIDMNRPQMNGEAAGHYQQGVQAFVGGNLAGARDAFTRATQADPKAYQAFYSLGVVQERLKDRTGAAASYQKAYGVVPSYEPAIVAYGMLKAKQGQTAEADQFLTKKRGEIPKSAAIPAALAEVKSISGDTGTAQQLAQEALKINPNYRPAMIVIARDHYRHRRIDLALYSLQAILDGFDPKEENPPRDKDNAEALLLRGIILREQGNRAGAMDQFQKAIQRRPDLVEARVALATFLLEAGSADQALPLLEGALRFDADNLAAHLALGDTYRLLGRYPEAKQRFEFVLSKNASLAQTHYNLGLLYLFAPSVPGMTPMQQVDAATASLKKFQELRKKGEADDSDELLQRAKLKRGELEAAQAAANPPPAPPPPAAPPASGAPAPGGAPAGGAPAGGAPAGGDADEGE